VPVATESGVSLIELLVAMLIFAVVALAISGSTLQASLQNRASEAETTAVAYAQDLLECYRLERIIDTTPDGSECSATAPAGFTPAVTVTYPAPGMQVQVTITWTRPMPGGSVTLTTLAL
jgi:prepilin-type N-terminal cleavage/methylation domain-containing protein